MPAPELTNRDLPGADPTLTGVDHPGVIRHVLTELAEPHRNGHTCRDGDWYNPHTGNRQRCATLVTIATALDCLDVLAGRVHAAAQDPEALTVVAQGMTGLVLAELEPEARKGWAVAAQLAVESLAVHLDTYAGPGPLCLLELGHCSDPDQSDPDRHCCGSES